MYQAQVVTYTESFEKLDHFSVPTMRLEIQEFRKDIVEGSFLSPQPR